MRKLRLLTALLLVGVVACEDPLTVVNANAPERERALGRPTDVQSLIVGSYNQVHSAHFHSGTAIWAQAMVMGLENYSSLANFGMNVRGPLPRSSIDNSRGNAVADGNVRDWNLLSRGARAASVGLHAFKTGITLGDAGADAQARMFAHFVMGIAMGDMALIYDQGTVISDADDPEFIPPLVGYQTVMQAALDRLDSAINTAAAATFPLPSTWINGSALTRTQFIAVARGYKARFRAGVGRNPTDRAAADWTAISADANAFLAGMTADFTVTVGVTGWTNSWYAQHRNFQNWHQMHQFIIGMADISGAYTTWLATQRITKSPFVIVTPDRRFPQGLDRTTQNGNSPALPTGFLYLRNRNSGDDTSGDGLGISFYDHYRFQATFNAIPSTNGGPFTLMTQAEMRLLAAEAALRANDFATANSLIDITRVGRGQLPALTGVITDATMPVPGGNACVPKVPPGGSPNGEPDYTWAAPSCGNIWEALKWEKRLETAYTGWSQWYIDARGWGDLPLNTAVHWPVPYQELDTRLVPIYHLGGGSFPGSAARGTYGL